DDELPEAARRAGRTEVLEIEGEDRSSHRLRDRHHAAVDEPEVEVGEAHVDLDRTPQKSGREERHPVLARDERLEQQPRRAAPTRARRSWSASTSTGSGTTSSRPSSVTSAAASPCARSRRFAAATSGPVSATT